MTEQMLLNRLLGIGDSTGVFSYSKDAVKTTSYSDDYLVNGSAHEIHRRFNIDNTTVKFLLDTSSVTSDSVFTLPIVGVCSADQVYIDTYKITSYTGGTEIPSINPNTIINTPAEAVFYEDITSTDVAGDDLRQYIFGTQAQGNVSGGGIGSGNHAKIFTPVI
jgi:hypothetical protein